MTGEQITLHLDKDVVEKYKKVTELAGVTFDQAIAVVLSLKVVNEMPHTAEALVGTNVLKAADTRSVTTDALETLGMIHVEQQKRDAIHLAVEPVIAAMTLVPGEHICLGENGLATVAPPSKALGIVDPFLTTPVEAGESFWLVVYPRRIKSLRHVWEHPDFPPSTD